MQNASVQWWHTEAVRNTLFTGIHQNSAKYSLGLELGYIETMHKNRGTLRQSVILFLLEFVSAKQDCVEFFPCGLFSGTPPFHSVPPTVGPSPLLPPPTFHYVSCTLQTVFSTLPLHTPLTNTLILKQNTHMYTRPRFFICSCLYWSQLAFSHTLSHQAETLLKCAHDI